MICEDFGKPGFKYKIDDRTGKIDRENSEIKEFLRIDHPQVALIADSDGRIGFDDKRNAIFVVLNVCLPPVTLPWVCVCVNLELKGAHFERLVLF